MGSPRVPACLIAVILITAYALFLCIAALLQDWPFAGLLVSRGPLALFSLGLASRPGAAAPAAGQAMAAAGNASGLVPRTTPKPTPTPEPTAKPSGEGRGPVGGDAGGELPLPAVLELGWFSDPNCTRYARPWRDHPRTRDVWRPNGTCLLTQADKLPVPQGYQFACNESLGLVVVRRMDRDCSRELRQLAMTPEVWQRIKQGQCLFYGTSELGNDVYSRLNTTLPTSYGVGCAGFSPPPQPSIGDQAGVTCPPGSITLGLGGGRRLELNVLLPSKFRDHFASDQDRPYEFCMNKVMVTFENQWNEPPKNVDKQQRGALGIPRNESSFSDVKLLLAVMTPTYACDVRNAHRATWMTHSRVCALGRHAEAGCSVMPLFVFANVSRDGVEDTDDIVFLRDVTAAKRLNSGVGVWWGLGKNREMWREGQHKTLAWFRHALQYPWATHIAKMDIDTYPFVNSIYNDLRRLPATRVFYGRYFHWWRGGMYGELYLVTKDIAARWVDVENVSRNKRGQQFDRQAEDQVFAAPMRMGVHTYWFSVRDCPGGRWFHLR